MTSGSEGVGAAGPPDYAALREQIEFLTAGGGAADPVGRAVPDPDVSVAMPARNVAPFVAAAVRSVLRQVGPTLELIVLDDGSEDGTAEVVSAIEDPRLVLLRNDRPRGIGYAHNRILERARAPTLVHVDADDLVLPGALALAHAAMQTSERIGQAFAWFVQVDGEGRLTREQWKRQWSLQAGRRPVGRELRRDLLVHGMVANHLRTYRRSALLELGGFDEALWYGVDYEMTLRIADRYAIERIPHVLYCLRIHGGNTQQLLRFRALRAWLLRTRLYVRHARRSPRFLGFTRPEAFLHLGRGLLEVLGVVRALKRVVRPFRRKP